MGTPLPMSPCPAPVPLSVPGPRVKAGRHAQTTAGGMCQMWLLPALGMPLAVLWERQEQDGGKGRLGKTVRARYKVPTRHWSKSPRVFPRARSPTLLATPGCSVVPPPSSSAILGCCRRATPSPPCPSRRGTEPLNPAAVGHCHPPTLPGRCGSGVAGSGRAGQPSELRLFFALMLNTQR